ncbi:hypothetical protein [Rahnella perminowiae]|uniref:hypothetical protein n=1 Tax=Rahnella perminowiae TaxID=2816244 RepID=UPI00215D03BE|nr:hypothetical protein [Rahnella perminowiae]MCR9003117.1 hypothetical protein [Rahnella perminowiae]
MLPGSGVFRPGNGMELRLIQTLIAHHRGSLDLSVRPDGGTLLTLRLPVQQVITGGLKMIQLPTVGPVIRRFDMSAQFTALYRISVALSQESNTGRALAAILEVLHDHAFVQYGMVCLFDKERNALFVESLHGIDGERKKDPPCPLPHGEGVIGAVMSRSVRRWCYRAFRRSAFLDRLNIYDYSLPLIGVPIPGADNQPSGVLGGTADGVARTG